MPTGERRSVKAAFDSPLAALLPSLIESSAVAPSRYVFRANDQLLSPDLTLREQGLVPGSSVSLDIRDSVSLAAVDIARRRKTQDDWRDFFTELTQRLIPDADSFTAEYVRLVLTGQKETLRLLDVREYKFPKWMYAEKELACETLVRHCLHSAVMRDFVLKDCRDQEFLLKVVATLDYGHLLQVRRKIELRKQRNNGEKLHAEGRKREKVRVETAVRAVSSPATAPPASPRACDITIEIPRRTAPLQPVLPIVRKHPAQFDHLVEIPVSKRGSDAANPIDLD